MARTPEEKQNAAEVRQQTREILAQNGNRLILVMQIMVCLLFVALFLNVWNAYTVLIKVLQVPDTWLPVSIAVLITVDVLLMLFLVFPTVLGLFYSASRMCRGETALVSDLFRFFTSRHLYRRALGVCGRWTLQICMTATLCLLVITLKRALPQNLPFGILCWGAVAAIVIAGTAWHLFSYSALFFVIENETIPVFAVWDMPFSHLRTAPIRQGIRFAAYWFLHLALGLLTFGVLWIWDTFPRMPIAYFCDCRKASEPNLGEDAYTDLH